MAYLLVPKGEQVDLLLAIPSRTLRTLRSHFRKHENDLELATNLWNDYMGITPMQHGLAKALRQALVRLQYEIKPDLQVVDTWGRTLHICHSPIQEWDLSLKEQLHDLARYRTRSDMQCVDRGFDVVGTLKALQKFSWADQCLL